MSVLGDGAAVSAEAVTLTECLLATLFPADEASGFVNTPKKAMGWMLASRISSGKCLDVEVGSKSLFNIQSIFHEWSVS
jgi:hypothetical protein